VTIGEGMEEIDGVHDIRTALNDLPKFTRSTQGRVQSVFDRGIPPSRSRRPVWETHPEVHELLHIWILEGEFEITLRSDMAAGRTCCGGVRGAAWHVT